MDVFCFVVREGVDGFEFSIRTNHAEEFGIECDKIGCFDMVQAFRERRIVDGGIVEGSFC